MCYMRETDIQKCYLLLDTFSMTCVSVCDWQVTGVMTQGRGDGAEWVTSFMVTYSLDAFNWQYVEDQYGNQRVDIF